MNPSTPYSRLQPCPPTPSDDQCHCAERPLLKLMYALTNNPFHCAICNLEIPLDTLSLTHTVVEQVLRWRILYEACYRLWLDSGAYEAWAKGQLGTIVSPVNRYGLDVCTSWNNTIPLYYWYFQDQSDESNTPILQCPQCLTPLILYPNGIFEQYICTSCRIIMAK